MANDGIRTDPQSHHVHLDKRSLKPDNVGNERRDRENCTCISEAVGWLLVIGVEYPPDGSGAA